MVSDGDDAAGPLGSAPTDELAEAPAAPSAVAGGVGASAAGGEPVNVGVSRSGPAG